MKSVSFRNLVLLITVILWGRVQRRYGILVIDIFHKMTTEACTQGPINCLTYPYNFVTSTVLHAPREHCTMFSADKEVDKHFII